VLRLQVHPPAHGIVERLPRRLQAAHRFGVVHPLEAGAHELLHAPDATLVDALGEEGHVIGALLEHGAEDVAEELLRQVGVVVQVGEGDLRLDHPELREVAAGVRVLRAEGRPEGVHARERQAVGLDVELPRDGQVRGPAEEVLREVDGSVARPGEVDEVERRHAEELPCPLRVARRDDRRVDPVEAALVMEAVDRL